MRRTLILIAGMLALAGCAASTANTSTTGTTNSPALVTTSTRAAAPKTAAKPQTFKGNGTSDIGTIVVPQDSTLRWTNDGLLFTAFDSSFGLDISSQAHSGASAISAGTYAKITVSAQGNWTIRIVPGA